jgi:divalent metal cation (Fe/Co/Zn/Cd) transporter
VSEHSTPLVQLGIVRPLTMPLVPSPAERSRLERRARMLAWGGIAWHVVEFAIALAAGIAAGSIALIGFGADSLIEAVAGFVVLWLFTGDRRGSRVAERRAQRLIAATFFVLAAYVGVESVRALVQVDHPQASWVGIGLAAFTALTMPLLARTKRQVGHQLNSSAAVKEASQTSLCAYLSIALLIGLGANALLGWWWADPLTALAIAAVAVKEGRESWRGEGCADCC